MPVPCFLLFLVSEISTRKISSKSGEIFSPESEDHLGGGPRGPHPMGARPRVGPRPARVWWPWLAPGAHPSPIYCPRRENPNTNHHLPRKVPSRPSSSISDRGVLTFSRHPAGGEIITGGFYFAKHIHAPPPPRSLFRGSEVPFWHPAGTGIRRRSSPSSDRKSTRLNSSHSGESRMPSSA